MALVGRASLAVKQRDLLKEEVAALRAEQRELAEVITPISRYLWSRAAIEGDPELKVAAGNLVYLARRARIRSGDDAA